MNFRIKNQMMIVFENGLKDLKLLDIPIHLEDLKYLLKIRKKGFEISCGCVQAN